MQTPIVVINMDKSADRLKKISANLSDLNLKFNRFSAINGKTLANDEIVESTTFMARTLLCCKSVIGCSLSHTTLWKNFLRNDYGASDILCVMEDDIQISQEFSQFINEITSIQKNTGFQMLSLNGNGIYNVGTPLEVGKYKFIKNPVFPLSAACYFITRSGATKILNMLGPKINYMIDFSIALGMLFNKIDYVMLISPKLVYTSLLEPSTINSSGSGGLVMYLLRNNNLKWYLNIPIASILMTYDLSLYNCILILLLVLSIYKKWSPMILAIGIELVLLNY